MPGPLTRSELLKGTRLGSYEVGALIGHGGMGERLRGEPRRARQARSR